MTHRTIDIERKELANGMKLDVTLSYEKHPHEMGVVKLHVQPVTIEKREGITVTKYMGFSGYKSKIGELRFWNEGMAREMLKTNIELLDQMIKQVLKEQNTELVKPQEA